MPHAELKELIGQTMIVGLFAGFFFAGQCSSPLATTSLAKNRRYFWESSARPRCADDAQQHRLGAVFPIHFLC